MPVTKAFIFAAGLGTRLRPYTDSVPKPLLPVLGRPLIEYVLAYLAEAAIRDVTVNTSHLADQFEVLPGLASRYGIDLKLSRQPKPYGHGGDLAFAGEFLSELEAKDVFVAINGDTVFSVAPVSLRKAATALSEGAPIAIVSEHSVTGALRLRGGELVGVGERWFKAEHADAISGDDTGLKMIHASVKQYLPEPGTWMSFYEEGGLVDKVVSDGKRILCCDMPELRRVEIGSVADFERHHENQLLLQLTRRLAVC